MKVSHSAREMYETCNHKYYLHHIEGYRTSIKRSPLVFGNAFDLALNEMLLGSTSYHELFDTEWDKLSEDHIEYYKSDLMIELLTDEELSLSENKQYFISMKRKGHLMLDAYMKHIMPRIKSVVSIQGEIELEGSSDDGQGTGDVIVGKLDLIAMIEKDDGTVVKALLDNKSTSAPYPKNSVQTKDQLPLYAVGFPDIETFGYLTINKKTFKTQVILDSITEEKKQEVLAKFTNMIHNVKEKRFDKNDKACWKFNSRCEFYELCKHGKMSKHLYKRGEK